MNSWNDLRSLIVEANAAGAAAAALESPAAPTAQNLLLCPFHIKKEIDENTNHWAEFLNIKTPMNIVCKKERPSDACWVEVVGEKCTFNENCGRAMIKVSSDDVTIDGLKISKARDNVIAVSTDMKRIRLIGLEFYGSNIPGNDSDLPDGLISINARASVHIIDSTFAWNQATVVENKGSLVIHKSRFSHNRVRTQGTMGGAIANKGAGNIVMISSIFTGNRASIGPAIYSVNTNVVDGGLNCASLNKEFKTWNECNGIYDSTKRCIPILGGECTTIA